MHMLACYYMEVCAYVCMLLHGSLCICLHVITWKFVHMFACYYMEVCTVFP